MKKGYGSARAALITCGLIVFAVLAAINLWPLLWTIRAALIVPPGQPLALRGVLTDPTLQRAVGKSLALVLTVLPIVLALATGAAFALRSLRRGATLARCILLAPLFIPPVVVALGIRLMVDQVSGPGAGFGLSQLLEWFSLDTAHGSFHALVGGLVWQWAPPLTVLLAAVLPRDGTADHEIGALDGLSGWARLRVVDWPRLRPLLGIATVIVLLEILRSSDLVVPLTNGGPGTATATIAFELRELILRFQPSGYTPTATLLLWIGLSGILLVLTRTGFRVGEARRAPLRLPRPSGKGIDASAKVLANGILASLIVFVLMPLLTLCWVSLSPRLTLGHLAGPWSFDSYRVLFGGRSPDLFTGAAVYGFPEALWTSVVIAVSASIAAVVLIVPVVARLTGSTGIQRRTILATLGTRTLPSIVLVPPTAVWLKAVGAIDTPVALGVVYLGLAAPLAMCLSLLLPGDFAATTRILAGLDGITRIRSWVRVMAPTLIRSALVIAISVFAMSWTEYLAALLLGGGAVRTAPIVLAGVEAPRGIQWGPLAAGGVIMILPALLGSGLLASLSQRLAEPHRARS